MLELHLNIEQPDEEASGRVTRFVESGMFYEAWGVYRCSFSMIFPNRRLMREGVSLLAAYQEGLRMQELAQGARGSHTVDFLEESLCHLRKNEGIIEVFSYNPADIEDAKYKNFLGQFPTSNLAAETADLLRKINAFAVDHIPAPLIPMLFAGTGQV